MVNLTNALPNTKISQSQQRELLISGDTILQILIEKLGDNLQKIRQNSEDAIIGMCLHAAFGPRICLQALTSPPRPEAGGKANNKKSMNSNKQIIGKYQTLARILSDTDLVVEPPMYNEALKYSIQGVQH